ncbi:MAG TPA: prepilin-type N-terminal cleavage/methylation domain-containing protein [Firmicutes bacterium]|nr:prepilin-type N-terminal cleavage/methylation domain-containing protein [Bacillota bacterium]HOQ23331.1 prepilin-type N-terminal cleavage/methylation domain-containing protein [Bacillota bacterium]HPT66751.1 prepilin-type N-terminal cleavage/methylation domain-containing protein [Bacillota bacterium]
MVGKLSFRNEKGFTFIELITVVLLISVLATIAMLNYSGVQRQAKTDLVNADLKILRAAVRAYCLDHNNPPPDLNRLAEEGYIDENPDDKFAPAGTKYSLQTSMNSIKIRSVGPDGIIDTSDDIVIDFSL